MCNIGIIDADLIGRPKHRFPNLACMKISGYYKSKGYNVELLLSYDKIKNYDKVYISKVFTDTPIPDLSVYKNVECGGTGFFYDQAEPLPYEIEHHMPDYHLYDNWVNDMIKKGCREKEFEYYTKYSIGFTTRGCFRHCEFCVNKNYNKVVLHSPIDEFLDEDRKYICLLDDNILGFSQWEDILNSLIATKKPFQYKQGLDIRLMTDKKAEKLSKCKYIDRFIFAFDDIKDTEQIIKGLTLWKKYKSTKRCKFYILCAFDRQNKYNNEFWINDIISIFERVIILMNFGSYPYLMRYEKYKESPFYGMYVALAQWLNQPNIYQKKSFREFCLMRGEKSSIYKYMKDFEKQYPSVANTYFNLKYSDLLKY